MGQSNKGLRPDLNIISGNEVTVKEIGWLWNRFIPYGKVTILQGDPGDGKSTFMLNIAARLTRGEPLPLDDPSFKRDPVNVIYQTTEDDLDDTVMPRFLNAGGDPERLFFINEENRPLTFADRRIREAIELYSVKLLILDPLSAYIGNCSLNQANEVRLQFNHLIRTARETGCAIVVIAHMNKAEGMKAVYRTAGSIDVVGAARSTLLIARTDSDDDSERVMVQAKSNLAPMGEGIIFRLGKKIEFIGVTDCKADDLLVPSFFPVRKGRPDEQTQAAVDAILCLLADGPVPAVRCESYLRGLGIGMTTAKKAKKLLGVISQREGNGWAWALSEQVESPISKGITGEDPFTDGRAN